MQGYGRVGTTRWWCGKGEATSLGKGGLGARLGYIRCSMVRGCVKYMGEGKFTSCGARATFPLPPRASKWSSTTTVSTVVRLAM